MTWYIEQNDGSMPYIMIDCNCVQLCNSNLKAIHTVWISISKLTAFTSSTQLNIEPHAIGVDFTFCSFKVINKKNKTTVAKTFTRILRDTVSNDA